MAEITAEFDPGWYGGYDTYEEALIEYTRARGLPIPSWNKWRQEASAIAAQYDDSPASLHQGGGAASREYSRLRVKVNSLVFL